MLEQIPGVDEYFEAITEVLVEALDDPRAGLSQALEEYMIDQGAFGTSGVGAFDGEQNGTDLLFECWGVDEIFISEGANGYINTIYRETNKSVAAVVERYGIERVSAKTREAFENGKLHEQVKILQAIEPRSHIPPGIEGNLAMPWASIHIESEANHILIESGYNELPVMVSRFYKAHNEVYGRSPALQALPDILEINATKEARISAIEKSLDPPLGVIDDGVLGNGEIDTSAGGINVFNVTSGRVGNQQPIFPLFTVGTIREVDKSIEELSNNIMEHFNIDRLLDFNTNQQMTASEAVMRDRIRSESLTAIFTRQISELFTPLVERAVSILFRKGKLGVIEGSPQQAILEAQGHTPIIIPEPVLKLLGAGREFYKVRYFTPAARMLEVGEAEGVMRTWEFAGSLAQADPSVLDNLDADESLKVIGRVRGAPTQIMRNDREIAMIRQQRAQQQQMAQKAAMAQQGAEIAKTGNEADQVNQQIEQAAEA